MPKLYAEDQAKVDAVIGKGIYNVDRKPFRPLRLLLVVLGVLALLTLVSYGIAGYHGFV